MVQAASISQSRSPSIHQDRQGCLLHTEHPSAQVLPQTKTDQDTAVLSGLRSPTCHCPFHPPRAPWVKEDDLFPIATNLNTVTGAPVDLIGGIMLIFTGTNPQTGAIRCTRQLSYVSRSVPYPFLSREACTDLGTIPASFPAIGSCDTPATAAAATASHKTLH